MLSKPDRSPALTLLRLIWDQQGAAFGHHSWDRLNHGMAAGLKLAITYGLRFNREDFTTMAARPSEGGFNSHYWLGETGGEWAYRMACGVQDWMRIYGVNMPACQAFEHWKQRPPYLLAYPRPTSRWRLHVGARFRWEGESVTVTSFAADGRYLTACAYANDDPRCKVRKRFTITPAALKAYNKRVRDQAKQHVSPGPAHG